MSAWLFCRLWKVSNLTLFQMMLVTVLLATVLGDCGPPPKLPFASPTNLLYDTEFKTGTILKYTCHPGYGKINSSRLTCDAKGSWSYSIFCAKKRCRNPGGLINGIVEVKKDLLLGSTIEFSCSEGFFLIGSTTSHCQIQGKGVDWSDPLPECVIAKCESPPDIRNGKHNGGDQEFYIYASSVTYSCNPHFSLIGNASIYCTVENKTIGVWSPNPPICEKIVCRQPQIPKAIFISGFGPLYTYRDSIVINCEEGYILRGSNLIYCEANSDWYPSVPSCVSNGCINLPDISYASWERNDYNLSDQEIFEIGTELKYLCKPGYRPVLDEPLTVTCQENLTWTFSNECERVCCPTPDLENIRIINERKYFTGRCAYAYGDYILYMCDEGYYPISVGGKSSCHTDGTWKPKIPACEPALCLKPEIVNGRLSVDKDQYVEPENVTIQCDSGYGLVGPKSITCSEERTWYPEVPRCEWEVSEGCEQVLTGRKLMQCLPSPEDVKMALEVYKLSLEIEQLEKERDKLVNTHQKFSEKEERKDLFFPLNQYTESSFNSTLP
ncbi:zona pellucida sperm-binding protein 3 receptor-like [Cebus imitator]|uniref:zona pellucida sperm-binding protein 3 receptor-like n=1 Tax=Cebus imitator TaxID=2715852 RepID=UPI001897695C|nr:zona pellucida sperm-binding protein 3 receptor-like [Cebus imitator]